MITETGGLRAQTHVFDRFRRSWVVGERHDFADPPHGGVRSDAPGVCESAAHGLIQIGFSN